MKFCTMLLVLALSSFGAAVQRTFPVTASSTLVLTAVQHGYTCSESGKPGTSVRVIDSGGVLVSRANYSISVTSCVITFNFGSSFTGNVVMKGNYALTSSGSEFAVTQYDGTLSSAARVVVCTTCSETTYAYRTGWGIMERPIEWVYGGGSGGTLRVWIENGIVIFGMSDNASSFCSNAVNGDCGVQSNVSAFPSGVRQIASCSLGHAGGVNEWSSCTDLRSF